jgi:hypothetical protein
VIRGPNGYIAPQYGRPYDVSIDGQRFLMIQGANTVEARAHAQPPLIVVQNWFEELKRLVPTN